MKKLLFIISTLFLLLSMGYAQESCNQNIPTDSKTLHFSTSSTDVLLWESFDAVTFPPAGWRRIPASNLPPPNPPATLWNRFTMLSQFVYGGVGASAAVQAVGGSAFNSWLMSPQIAIPSTGVYNLEFWSAMWPVSAAPTAIELMISTTDDVQASFTVLRTIDRSELTTDLAKLSTSLAAYAGEDVYIAFRFAGIGSAAGNWSVDEVKIVNENYIFVDAELRAITAPVTGENLTATEQVKVQIRNNGDLALTIFDLKLELNGDSITTETYTASIPSMGQVEYTFATGLDLFAGGDYTITVTAIVENDAVPTNNSRTITVANFKCPPISVFPWTEGFESADYDTNPNANPQLPICWESYCVSVCGSGSLFPKNWVINPLLDYVHSGKLSAIRWTERDGDAETWLVSPQIVIPTTGIYTLEFWSINRNPQNNVYNGVWISTTGQNPTEFTFVELKQLSGYEVSETFKKVAISLADYAGDTVHIGFKYTGLHGDSWIIDDVTVINREGYIDAEVLEITTPNSGINLSANEPVSVKIRNHGLDPISGFELKLEHNGDSITTEIYTGTIAGLGLADYTFTTTLDLSAGGNHAITVTVIVAEDADNTNDAKTITIQNYLCPPITAFPWIEGFNPGTGIPICWHRIDADGDGFGWTWVAQGSNGAAGSFAVHDYGEFGQVPLNPDNWLLTPQLVLDRDLTLSYKVSASHPQYFYETYSVLVSTTGQNTSDFTEIFKETLTAGGSEVGFKTVKLSLRDFTGETVYIAFRHHDTDPNFAFALIIDDVEVFDFVDFIDGEVTSILTPVSGTGLTSSEQVTVQLKNNGSDPISNFTLKLELNGTEIATETYTGTIASLGTAQHTFTPTLDLSTVGIAYAIMVTINVTGDQVASNNSLTKRVAKFSTQGIELTGYRIYEEGSIPSRLGFVKFNSNTPGTITQINNHQPSGDANSIFAGEYVNGDFYYFSVFQNVMGYSAVNLVKMSTNTWTVTSTVPVTGNPVDMAYDYATQTMYGIVNTNPAFSTLVRINLETGELIGVGGLGQSFYALACNTDGQLYGIDKFGRYCAINKTTGVATSIGSTGLYPEYIQSMGFDHNTGRLFWAAVNTRGEASLVELEPTSGIAFDRGALIYNSEIIGLHTPYTHLPRYTITASAGANGTITPNGTITAIEGNDYTFIITPNTDYEISQVLVDGTNNLVAVTNGSYTFTNVTANHTIEAVFVINTSIQDIANEIFRTYPNPVKDVMYIETEQIIKQIFVLDLQGKVLMQLQGNHRTVDLQSVPAGFYIIRIHTETTVVPIKIMKQ
ncbi:MAG: choice-of-anchor J domain-containing protein [Bacteroidales bacterium]|jgi:hypothetical protein|nr:choice-of-anchor J domain-containing protein [Bacteroidales bacterium]